MVKKKIVIFSLVLLCSSVARADVSDPGASTLPGDSSSLTRDPNEALKGLMAGNSALPGSTPTNGAPSSYGESPSIPSSDILDPEAELRTAAGKSVAAIEKAVLPRIAVLENALKHFDGSLASEFLSTDALAIINQEIEAHKKLVIEEIDILSVHIVDVLKSKVTFVKQDVLNVIAECQNLQNRREIVEGALKNIFLEIANLNMQAGKAGTAAERAILSTKRAALEKTEAYLEAAMAGIIESVPFETPKSNIKLFKFIPASSSSARTTIEAFAFVGAVTVVAVTGKVLGFWKPE